MKNRKNRIATVLGGIVLFLIMLYVARMHILSGYFLWVMRHDTEKLDRIPTARALEPVTPTHTLTATIGDLRFEVPFTEQELTRKIASSTVAAYVSNERRVVVFYMAESDQYQLKFVLNQFPQFFDPPFASNADVYAGIQALTYSGTHFFKSPLLMWKDTMLLLNKDILTPENNGAYTLSLQEGFSGWEFLTSATSTIMVMFSPSDAEYSFAFTGLSQGERDAILASVRENETAATAAVSFFKTRFRSPHLRLGPSHSRRGSLANAARGRVPTAPLPW